MSAKCASHFVTVPKENNFKHRRIFCGINKDDLV